MGKREALRGVQGHQSDGRIIEVGNVEKRQSRMETSVWTLVVAGGGQAGV